MNWAFKPQHPSLVRPSTSDALSIVQLGQTADYPIAQLTEKVAKRFPTYEVTMLPAFETPKMALDSQRNQYHSTRILAIIEEHKEVPQNSHVLGVITFDLYVPGMNFVFGEARCPGRAAVISTYRLGSARVDSSGVFRARVVKEAVHEIGHMFGLKHCTNATCVMHFSERLADTDRKQDDFCTECEQKMKWLLVE